MKKKMFIFATCHADRISEVLKLSKSFRKYFDIETQLNFYKPGNVVNVEDILEKFDDSDIFLFHKTASIAEKIPSILSSDKAISIPYITSSLYWPSYDFTKIDNPLLVFPPFKWGLIPWHCKYLDELIESGLPNTEIIDNYIKKDLSEIFDLNSIRNSQHNYFKSLDCQSNGIVLSEWLIARISKEKLFHIYNHPTSKVFIEIVRQLLELIGIPNDLPSNEKEDRFSIQQFPIHPSVARYYDLSFFDPDKEYRLGPHKVTLKGYLNIYIEAVSKLTTSSVAM